MAKIGITQRVVSNKHGARMDCLEQTYLQFYSKFGAPLVQIPNTLEDPVAWAKHEEITHIILSGGGDVNPELYSMPLSKEMDVSADRDSTEGALLKWASQENIPVLGICRGVQFINVFFGGSLSKLTGHSQKIHQISFLPKSSAFFECNSIEAVCYHDFGIDSENISKELNPLALSEGDVIEFLHHPKLPIAGVQWHPERANPKKPEDIELMKAFVEREWLWR